MRISRILVGLLFIPIVAHAHGGGLNKEGCHNNRKTGDYHCHRGPKASARQQRSSKQETLTGIPKIVDGDTIRIGTFVDHYNHQRYHESINNLTPADVYFGRGQAILNQRERIKRKTIETRRLHHRKHAA